LAKEIEEKDFEDLEESLTDFINNLADENSSMIDDHKEKLKEKIDEIKNELEKKYPHENKNILNSKIKILIASAWSDNMLAVLENDWYQSLVNMEYE